MSDRRPIDVVLELLDKHDLKSSGDTGRQWECRCPAHGDRHRSLSVAHGDGDVVLLKCFTGCTAAEVCKAIGLDLKDLFPQREKVKRPPGVTVNQLAFEKRLPAEWLRDYCKVRDGEWRHNGTDHRAVVIPYLGTDGAELFPRYRFSLSAKQGTRQPGKRTLELYGLWLLESFRARGGPLFVVEGESDCWALWLNGFNAVGVPGANAAETAVKDVGLFAGFAEVIVWQEPDDAGSEFPNVVGKKLSEGKYQGRIAVVRMPGAKDPADVYARDPSSFARRMNEAHAGAKPWDASALPVQTNGALPQTVRRVEAILRETGHCKWGEFEFTEAGNAGRLERLHGNDLRYVPAWNQWYRWDGKRWDADQTLEIYRRTDLTVQSLMLEAQSAPGRSGMEDAVKWWTRSQSARAADSTIKLARSLGRHPVGIAAFDRDPWAMNCPNGTVDLRTGEVRPHRREDMLTIAGPTPYEPDAECHGWEVFLDRVFPNDPADPEAGGNKAVIRYVQRLFGYCLSGVVVSNMLPIFWGHGSNGKSTLLEVVQDVVGPGYTMQAPPNFLMARDTENHPTELADLYGKRLVIASETKKRQHLDEALVKQLTGGDKIRARRMREDFWQFDPTHKLILCSNHKPIVKGTDAGIWRRLLLVAFLAKFWDPDAGHTGHELYRQDKTMKTRLRAEAPGILAWFVRGCLDWQKEGLEQPVEVRDITREYRQEEDVFGRFLADRYVKSATGETTLKDMHADYVRWCTEQIEKPMIPRLMAAELRSRGLETKAGHGGRQKVVGLAVRSAGVAGSPY